MKEVVLDTETTGLSVSDGHRIVEIGCIELENLIPTNNFFHCYLNPQRKVSETALKVHGYTDKFLSDKKKFKDVVDDFLSFIDGKKIIIHNANFDLGFLNGELAAANKKQINKNMVIDSLDIARNKFPGTSNSLDALCKRFNVDNSRRTKHTALIDCQLLKEVYINLVDQKEPKLDFKTNEVLVKQIKDSSSLKKHLRKNIKPNKKELEEHKSFLKSSLQKNYFN